MKQFILLITALSVIVSCRNARQTTYDNIIIDTHAIHSAIQKIESHLDSLNHIREIIADAFPGNTIMDSSKVIWDSFILQCNENKYEEAYNNYRKHRGDFKVHLTHSTPRYIFISNVLYPLMQKYENPDSLEIKYLDELELEYYMQVSSIQLASEDNPYIPEVHHLTIIDYGRALNRCGRGEEAHNLTTELKDAVLFLTGDEMEAHFAVFEYGANLFNDSGETDTAIEILSSLKSKILSWWKEDIDEDGAKEYYGYYISKIDSLMNKLYQE